MAPHERIAGDSDSAAGRPSWAAAPTEVRVAAGVIAVQSLALVVTAIVLLAKTLGAHPDSLGRALLDAGFALGAAAILVFTARSLLRLTPSARTPVIVVELLALPVGYSLGFQAGLMIYGGPMLVSALAVLYLLFTPAARAALDRDG